MVMVGDMYVPDENVLMMQLTFRHKLRLLFGKRVLLHVQKRLKGKGRRHYVVEVR